MNRDDAVYIRDLYDRYGYYKIVAKHIYNERPQILVNLFGTIDDVYPDSQCGYEVVAEANKALGLKEE